MTLFFDFPGSRISRWVHLLYASHVATACHCLVFLLPRPMAQVLFKFQTIFEKFCKFCVAQKLIWPSQDLNWEPLGCRESPLSIRTLRPPRFKCFNKLVKVLLDRVQGMHFNYNCRKRCLLACQTIKYSRQFLFQPCLG